MRCLSKITDTQGNEFNLMQINDFSVITSTIKGYTSPTTTNIWQAGSHTPPSWMTAQGDLLCKINTSTVAQLQENKMVDNDYLLFKYGRVIQGSDNFYGMGFYNNKNSAARLDTFGDGPSIGNQTVDCYLGIVLDDDNQRAYILACTDKYNDPSNNKFRIWALAGKYNGTDLYWETFGEVILNQSAGGAGLYGGYKGGAGSGYIGNSLVSNKKMVGYNVPTSSAEGTKTESVNDVSASAVSGKPKSGNGFARVKFIEEIYTDGKIIAVATKTPSAWVSVSDNDDSDYVCVADENGNELQAIQLSNALLLWNRFESGINAYLVQFGNLTENANYKFYIRHGNIKTIRVQRQVLSRTILFNHSDLKTFANNNSAQFVYSGQGGSSEGFISFTVNDSYLSWNGTNESYTNTNMSSNRRMIVNVPSSASRMNVFIQFKRTDSASLSLTGVLYIDVGSSSYSLLTRMDKYGAILTKDDSVSIVGMIDLNNLEVDRSNISNIAIRLNLFDFNHTGNTFNAQMSNIQVWAE